MPRVVHIIRKFEPAEWGGTETHLIAVLKELGKLGWECEVHAPLEQGTHAEAIELAGAQFHGFKARYPYSRLNPQRRRALVAAGGNLVSFHELTRLSLDRKASILHLHTLGRLGGIARTASKIRKIPYAVTLHGPVRADATVVESDARSRTQGMFDFGAPFGWAVGARRVVHDADLVFVLNQSEYKAWEKDRQGKHLERIAHGVALEQAKSSARKAARDMVEGLGNAPFVVQIARLDRAKGQDIAIEAFAKGAPENFHLVLAGSSSDDTFAAEVRALAAKHGERIHVIGGVSPEEARSLLAEADLALLPSKAEPFGIVLLEAWAEGCPTLISDIGGLGDIARKTKTESWLISPGNTSLWSRRIEEVLQDKAKLAQEHNDAPPRVAANYSWKTLAEKLDERYREAIFDLSKRRTFSFWSGMRP